LTIRAVRENRRLKDLVADLLRRGLAQPPEEPRRSHRLEVPLIETRRTPAPSEVSPERLKEALLAEETARYVSE
jgi:hypothetical protein